MIIFIVENSIDQEELKRLQEYTKRTNSGHVVIVRDIDKIKVDGR